jgi:uncharacterized protein YjbI with pentapeptide repeats
MEEPTDYKPPTSKEELLRRYASGERYFAESDLPDETDLGGVNLEGANLERSWLFGVNFSRANLRGVSFRESNIKCADFRLADLEGATFEGAAVESLLLEGANLDRVSFAHAWAYGYEFKDGEQP